MNQRCVCLSLMVTKQKANAYSPWTPCLKFIQPYFENIWSQHVIHWGYYDFHFYITDSDLIRFWMLKCCRSKLVNISAVHFCRHELGTKCLFLLTWVTPNLLNFLKAKYFLNVVFSKLLRVCYMQIFNQVWNSARVDFNATYSQGSPWLHAEMSWNFTFTVISTLYTNADLNIFLYVCVLVFI